MRADRLLSILMLLQSRGRLTAQELAAELEVSVRTIYRDMDALSIAGIPVYTERGPGGGCSLLDSYRTTLTGLNQDEVRALFMLSIPQPLVELGVDQELKAALRKLAASLPASRRQEEERVRQRIHLDSVEWLHSREPVPHLRTIQLAIWQDRLLHLAYDLPFQTRVERLVEPYGLVAKASVWYLVCAAGDRMRVHRVSQLADARLVEQRFERAPGFDLAAFWQSWCAEIEQNRPSFSATVRAAPRLLPLLARNFGDAFGPNLARGSSADAQGWITLTLPFETLEDARERILGFGGAMEVLGPRPLRDSVRDCAAQIMAVYDR